MFFTLDRAMQGFAIYGGMPAAANIMVQCRGPWQSFRLRGVFANV